MVKIVIGNKCDVEKDERRIETHEGKAYAVKNGFEFFETSAVTNNGSINEVFSKLSIMIREKFTEE